MGLGFSQIEAQAIYGCWDGLFHGGQEAGYRQSAGTPKSGLYGAIVITLGHLLCWLNQQTFFLGLAFVVLGTGPEGEYLYYSG